MCPMWAWLVGIVLAVLATANLYVPDLGGGLLTDPTTIALGISLVLALWAWGRDRFRLGRAHLVLAVVVVSFLPGLVMAADHNYGQAKVMGLLATFAVTGVALQLMVSPRVRLVFLWAVGVSGAVVAVALVLFGESVTYFGRWSIFELNPISLGRMAALGAVLAVLAAVRTRGGRLVALIAAAAVCAYAAFLTGSRGPALAAAIALLVAVPPGRRIRVSRRTAAIGAGVTLVGLVVAFTAATKLLVIDTSGRALLWQESFMLALKNPLGVGFGDLYGKVTVQPWETSTDTAYSHNVLLEAAVEGGWLALVGLVFALVASFRCLYRDAATRTGRAMLAVWVFALANACLSSDLVGNRLMWVMIGAGLALMLRDRTPGDGVTSSRPRVLFADPARG